MEMERAARPQSPPRAAAAAMSSVLGDDDLLREILFRLGLPTSLLRAALVCRRWYRHASDRAFLRSFRDRHPPRILGVYLHFSGTPRPRFFPVRPLPELATAARRAGSFVNALPGSSAFVRASRGGRLLVTTSDEHYGEIDFTLLVCSPLSPAGGDTVVVPPPPPSPPIQLTGHQGPVLYHYGEFLPVNGDGRSYSCVLVGYSGRRTTARLYELQQDMSWVVRASAAAQLPAVTPSRQTVMLLDDDSKLYILSSATRKILVCDFPSSSIATVDLPNGVEDDDVRSSIVLSRGGQGGGGSGIFLVHVKGPLLRLFHGLLHIDNNAGSNWSLVGNVCLRKVCTDLGIAASCWASVAAEGDDAGVSIRAAWHSAKFAILEMFGTVVFLDVESAKAEKVYEVKPEDGECTSVHPLMMMWPSSVFPFLEDG